MATTLAGPVRDAAPMLERVRSAAHAQPALWIFGYGSLIWRPDFDFDEKRAARVHGWHRALRMWSRAHRGTPEVPGLVFGMLSGGSCLGLVFRVPQSQRDAVLDRVWQREMVSGVYDPKWLPCSTPQGVVLALAFTLSRRSPNHAGKLEDDDYRRIFRTASGHYGTTRDYASRTFEELQRLGIRDRALERLLKLM